MLNIVEWTDKNQLNILFLFLIEIPMNLGTNLVTLDAFNLVVVFNFRLEKLPDRTALHHRLRHLALDAFAGQVGQIVQVVGVAFDFGNAFELLLLLDVLLFLTTRFLKLFELRKKDKF